MPIQMQGARGLVLSMLASVWVESKQHKHSNGGFNYNGVLVNSKVADMTKISVGISTVRSHSWF